MIPRWLLNISRGRNVLIALAIWILLSVYLFNFGSYAELQTLIGSGQILPEENLGYDLAAVHLWLGSLGETEYSLYRAFQFADLANAVLTGVAMTLFMTFVFSRIIGPNNPLGYVVLLPIVVGVADVAENVVFLNLIDQYPDLSSGLVSIGSFLTSVKLVGGLIAFPALLAGLMTLGIQAIYRRRRKPSRGTGQTGTSRDA